MSEQHVRVLQNFGRQTDAQLIAFTVAVIKGLTGNPALASPPVDLKVVQAAVDNLVAAIAAQPSGGRAATAHKSDVRHELIRIVRKLALYVQDTCGGDRAVVLNSGFLAVTPNRASLPVEKPGIAGVEFGNSAELVVKVNPVARARCYDVRTAAIGPDGVPGAWQNGGTFRSTRGMIVKNLTPGTTYSLQVRAFGGSNGHTDWSDPVSHICA